jgi:hypothetical protein
VNDVLIRNRKGQGTKRNRGEGHVKTEAEIRVMHTQAKENQSVLESTEPSRETWDKFSLRTSRKKPNITVTWTFDLQNVERTNLLF